MTIYLLLLLCALALTDALVARVPVRPLARFAADKVVLAAAAALANERPARLAFRAQRKGFAAPDTLQLRRHRARDVRRQAACLIAASAARLVVRELAVSLGVANVHAEQLRFQRGEGDVRDTYTGGVQTLGLAERARLAHVYAEVLVIAAAAAVEERGHCELGVGEWQKSLIMEMNIETD
jgi:hypothetical protein